MKSLNVIESILVFYKVLLTRALFLLDVLHVYLYACLWLRFFSTCWVKGDMRDSRALNDGGGRWSRFGPRSSGSVTVWPLDLKPSLSLFFSLIPHTQTCNLGQTKPGTWTSYLHLNAQTHSPPIILSLTASISRSHVILPWTSLNAFVFGNCPGRIREGGGTWC